MKEVGTIYDRLRTCLAMAAQRPWFGCRTSLVLLAYAALGTASYVLAFLIRFDSAIPDFFLLTMWLTMPLAVSLKLLAVAYCRVHRELPTYAGMPQLLRIVKASTASTVLNIICVILLYGEYGHEFPRSIYIIDYLITVLAFGGAQFFLRLFREAFRPSVGEAPGRRVLVLGAGDTGVSALKAIERDYFGVLSVVGLLDDDPGKWGMTLHGYPILGPIHQALHFIKELAVTEVMIAIPSATKERVRAIVEACSSRNVAFRILPTFRDYVTGKVEAQKIRAVSMEDLLGREPVSLDHSLVSRDLSGKRVLVTGAGGSIGSELARQIAKCNPALLLLLDMAETPLFEINQELDDLSPNTKRVSIFADIKHGDLLDKIFDQYKPDRVYHAAAYKHVPMNEAHPVEAVFNNVLGTLHVVRSAIRSKVEKLVLISTDKAVRPSSVMGATKRCAELLLQHMRGQGPKFIAVRFGNVLESAGSVVPIFRRQIARGGPLTVTHPDVERYFMTIPESVELVLQAGAIGTGGEIFILDMGKPIKIVDLARNMIELSGMEFGRDIEIRYTGLRPGEKLTEELVADGEDVTPTAIPKVSLHVATNGKNGHTEFLAELAALEKAAMTNDDAQVLAVIWGIIRRHDGDAAQQAGQAKARSAVWSRHVEVAQGVQQHVLALESVV